MEQNEIEQLNAAIQAAEAEAMKSGNWQKDTTLKLKRQTVAIESLPFVRERLALLQADKNDRIAVKRAGDRTNGIVRTWKVLS